ncbi:MAG: hypothetical protein M0P59_14430, partial [Gallionella sp.]|nr:hypothetical protein [Gallionella sp.]
MAHAIITPFIPYLDSRGTALQNGKIYFGVSGFIAEAAPLTVYWDRALTQIAAQPLRTINGYIVRGGTQANVFFDSTDYSVTAKNSQDVTLFNVLSALDAGFIDQDPAAPVVGDTSSGNRLQNTNFENNSAQLVFPATVRANDSFIDRYTAGASGATVSKATVNGINTMTISSGSIIQRVVADIIGPFILSWEGTANARINGGAYSSSPLSVTAGSTVATIDCEWATGTVSKVNLNYSSTPEPWIPGVNYYLFQQASKNNLVHNCDMAIDQEVPGLVTAIASTYAIDGWLANINVANGQAEKESDLIPYDLAGRYIEECLHVSASVSTASLAAAEFLYSSQRIEGYLLRELVDNPACVRFFAKARTPGVYCLAIRAGNGSKSYVVEYNRPTAYTWTLIEENISNIPADAISDNSTGTGIDIAFTG